MEYIVLALLTVAASTLTGTVGVGGALLIVPAMTVGADLFGLVPAEIRFIGYTMNFISLAPVVYGNWARMDLRMARPLVLFSMAGAVIGASAPRAVGERYLLWAFVVCLVAVLLLMIRRIYDRSPSKSDFHPGPKEWRVIGAIGFTVGLASGMFGIGGGVFMLPPVVLFLGIKPTNIILITPVTVLFSTGTGIAVALWGGQFSVPLLLAVVVTLAAVLGARLGDRLRGRMSDRLLMWTIIAVLGVLTLNVAVRAWTTAWPN